MAQRRGFSGSFNSPSPVDHSNDMIFSFIIADALADDQYFAPLGFSPTHFDLPPLVENNNVIVINRAGTLTTLLIMGDTNAATVTENFIVNKNGVDSTINAACVIGSPTAQDLTHSIGVAVGDLISIHHTLTGTHNFAAITGSLYFTPA